MWFGHLGHELEAAAGTPVQTYRAPTLPGMIDLLVNTAVSIAASLGLWALLPRGVVLTRAVRSHNHHGEPVGSTWNLRNDSALPIRIRSVRVTGLSTFNHATEQQREIELPLAGDRADGASLSFDDSTLETLLYVHHRSWKGVTIPPGDTLQAVVPNMHGLRIKYRRAGCFGILERREIVISGGI